jgi:hypothetical protein
VTETTDQPVITVTPTIMSGTVVRWYSGLAAAENGREVLSASRDGVMVLDYLTDVPAAWVDAALQAFQAMRADRRVNLMHLATHRHKHFMGHELVPVTTPAAEDGTDG